jgi:hypothetical protein
MKLGDAFLMPVPPKYDCEHLWFVISDPSKHSGKYIIVNATTDRKLAGSECILCRGDHPWLITQCFVNFSGAQLLDQENDKRLQLLIGTKVTLLAPLDAKILCKVVNAAKTSTAIPVSYKNFL